MKSKRSSHAAELQKRMGWLGYEFHCSSRKFEEAISIIMRDDKGILRSLFVHPERTDYDQLARLIHESTDDTIRILAPQEANDSDE